MTRSLKWWRHGALVTAVLAVHGCGSGPAVVDDYAALTGNDKARADAAVERFRTCTLDRARLLDDGRRRVNRLAWSATEHCIYAMDDIVRTLVELGTTIEYGIAYADDQRVVVAAHTMEVLQRARRAGAD